MTKRQIEIMNLVKLGHTNKQIGKELGTSIHTVKAHMNSIAQRLQTGDRAHAVYLCMKRGIID